MGQFCVRQSHVMINNIGIDPSQVDSSG